jgi:hypothetical protein
MLVCTDCRRVAATPENACEACGSQFWAEVTGGGTVVAFLGDSDVPCMRCGAVTDLAFRRYRRVVGGFILDRPWFHDLMTCRSRAFFRNP